MIDTLQTVREAGQVAVRHLRELLLECEEGIGEAVAEQFEADDAASKEKTKLPLTFRVELDITDGKVNSTLSWAVRRKAALTTDLEDPNQPGLPGMEEEEEV
jgi:hypothetical protein